MRARASFLFRVQFSAPFVFAGDAAFPHAHAQHTHAVATSLSPSAMGLLDAARAAIERNMQSPADRDAWWAAYTRRLDAARTAL